MGETDFHIACIIWLREALEDHFARRRKVYVASNMFYYFDRGNPRARRDPGVLVAKGVGKHMRLSYRVWEEGVVPQVFFEISSKKTWREDLGEKRQLYGRLGIREYFIFDPQNRYLDPALQGFRSRNGVLRPLKEAADGSLKSMELGLRMVPEGPMLRLFDGRTGKPILTRAEKIDQANQRAAELVAEIERLRAMLRQSKPRRRNGAAD